MKRSEISHMHARGSGTTVHSKIMCLRTLSHALHAERDLQLKFILSAFLLIAVIMNVCCTPRGKTMTVRTMISANETHELFFGLYNHSRNHEQAAPSLLVVPPVTLIETNDYGPQCGALKNHGITRFGDICVTRKPPIKNDASEYWEVSMRVPPDWSSSMRLPRELFVSSERSNFFASTNESDFSTTSINWSRFWIFRLWLDADDSIHLETLTHSRIQYIVTYTSRQFPDYLHMSSIALFSLHLILSVTLSLLQWIRFRFLPLIFSSSYILLAASHLFMCISDPIVQLSDTLSNFSTLNDPSVYLTTFDMLLSWFDWHEFVSNIQLLLNLVVIGEIFFNFNVKFLHLLALTAFLFLIVGIIGYLSLGDVLGTLTLQDVLVLQFQMISSDWPSELSVESRPLLFALWALGVACLIFCALSNFVQCVLESEYKTGAWWGSHVPFFLRTIALNRTRIITLIRNSFESEKISLETFKKFIPFADYMRLEKYGYISACTREMSFHIPSSAHKNQKHLSALLSHVDGIATWLSLHGKVKKDFTDRDLVEAVDASFRDFELHVQSTVLDRLRPNGLETEH